MENNEKVPNLLGNIPTSFPGLFPSREGESPGNKVGNIRKAVMEYDINTKCYVI